MGFLLSKILWMIFSPANALVFLLLIGTYLSLSGGGRGQKWGQRLCFFVALIFFAIAILPIDEWIAAPLENRFQPAPLVDVDGIILLGGDENVRLSEARHQPLMTQSAMRYIKFASLAHTFDHAILVFTGGPGLERGDAPGKDAAIARETLSNLGVSIPRITFEGQSRNTYENAVDAATMVHPKPDQNWLLVTSASHMPRAIACFRKAGWHVSAAPSDYISSGSTMPMLSINFPDRIRNLAQVLHEYCGLFVYWLLGYTDALWPH